MKFKQMLHQKNKLVFALTVRWLWKSFRMLKHLQWYNSAKRWWMAFPPGILWGCFWVPGHSGVWGNGTADKLARDGTVHQFVGSEPMIKRW